MPSTLSVPPPNACISSPVAVTMMSAGRVSPELTRTPSAVNRSMVSVTTVAVRCRAVKMSPPGALHTRWSHGR